MIELVTDIDFLTTRANEWDVRANQDISIKLVQDIDTAMDENPDLLFLVAQEVGHTERCIDVRFTDENQIFMNPLIQNAGRIVLGREYDRIEKKEYIVPRYSEIELIFHDCLGSIKAVKLSGPSAMLVCQAIDMLDGVYSSDIGLEIIPEFDQATPEEQQEVLNEYIKSLGARYDELDKELVSADEETKKKWMGIKFMAAKSRGEIEEYHEDTKLSKRKQKYFTNLVKKLKQRENKLKFWRKNK